MSQGMAWIENEHLELSAMSRISNFLLKVYEIINVCTFKSLEKQTLKTKDHFLRGRIQVPLIYFSVSGPKNLYFRHQIPF